MRKGKSQKKPIPPQVFRDCRKELGLDQAEFAELLGAGSATIWRWEDEGSRPINLFAMVGLMHLAGRKRATGDLEEALDSSKRERLRGLRMGIFDKFFEVVRLSMKRRFEGYRGPYKGRDPSSLMNVDGLTWFKEDEWDRWRIEFFGIPEHLSPIFPFTYGDWLGFAKLEERRLKEDGVRVHRIEVGIDEFREWCSTKGFSLGEGTTVGLFEALGALGEYNRERVLQLTFVGLFGEVLPTQAKRQVEWPPSQEELRKIYDSPDEDPRNDDPSDQ